MAGAPKKNRNSSRDNRLWANTIRRAVVQKKGEKLRSLADKLVELAAEGDISALREVGDRLDGKPAQSMAVTGEGGGPLVSKVEVILVNGKG